LIEDGDNYFIKNLSVEHIEINLIEENIDFELDLENSLLIGKGIIKINGESKKKIKVLVDAIDTEKKEQLMEYVVNNGKSRDYELVKVSDFDRKEPAQIEYTCQLNNQMDQFNDNWYIDLDPSKQLYQAKVEDDRVAPLDFGNRLCITEQIDLTLPDQLEVDNLPETIKLENDLLSVNIDYKVEGNIITYKKNIKVFISILKNDQFEKWNAAIDQLNEFYSNQIVLKKK